MSRLSDWIKNKIGSEDERDARKTLTPSDSVPPFDGKWVVAGASEMGMSHKNANPPIPCQDSHAMKSLEEGWGIAVLCDGAGSAPLSHIGSEFVVGQAIGTFEGIVQKNKWIKKGELPEPEAWQKIALNAFQKIRQRLELVAEAKEVKAKDYACTIIVVIYAPFGILTSHIGDGRAGYRDGKEKWHPIMTPHNGEEANITIFITSDYWLKGDFEMSGVTVPESRVITDAPTAFTLMSDGCESHTFETGYFDEKNMKYIHKNTPSQAFFETLRKQLLSVDAEGATEADIQELWSKFVDRGNTKFTNELDDKTLILGILNERQENRDENKTKDKS